MVPGLLAVDPYWDFCVWFGKPFFVAWAAAAFTGAIGWAIRQRVRIHAVLTAAAEAARRAIAAAAEAAAEVIYLNAITTGKVARSAMVVAKPTPDGQRARAE